MTLSGSALYATSALSSSATKLAVSSSSPASNARFASARRSPCSRIVGGTTTVRGAGFGQSLGGCTWLEHANNPSAAANNNVLRMCIGAADSFPEAEQVGGAECAVVEAIAGATCFAPDHAAVVGAHWPLKAVV